MYRVPYSLFPSLSEAGNLLSSKWAGCGMKLRGDDPGTMKDFVLSIQNSVNQLKLHSGVREDGKTDIRSRRVSYLVQCTYLSITFHLGFKFV